MTLPENYKHFYSAWDSIPNENKTLSNLSSRLMVEQTRQTQGHEVKKDIAGNSAFSARKSFGTYKQKHSKADNSGNQRNNDKKPGKCNHCKKLGHWKRDCRILKREQDEKNKNENSGSALLGVKSKDIEICDSEKWYVDSGASDHMTSRKEWFNNYELFETQLPVRIGDGKNIMAIGKGNINVQAKIGDKWVDSHLLNVLHVPKLKVNLFSCGACLDKGIKMMTDSNGCTFKRDNRIVAVGVRENKLFSMTIKTRVSQGTEQANIAVKNLTLQQWHEKLSHQNIQYVRNYLKRMQIPYMETKNEFFCEACVYGKQHREPFTLSSTTTTKPGQIIHSDVCGPMEEKSLGGKRYFVIFKDDYSKYTYVYFMNQKSEVKDKLELFLNTIKNQLDIKVNTLRSDCGLEYKNTEIKAIFDKLGIKHETSVPYTPQQNGKAERSMRTIVEAARTMLYSKNLSKSLWAEAVNTVVYTLNRTGNSGQEGNTPYELWFNKTPNINHLKIFGSEVYVHIPKEKRRKWDQKGRKGIFVGYSEETKGYRIYFDGREVSLSRDVIFREEILKPPEATEIAITNEKEEEEIISEHIIEGKKDDSDEEENPDEDKQISVDTEERKTMKLRDRETIKKPIRYRDAFYSTCNDPVTYEEAMTLNNADDWREAMNDEISSLIKNETWKLVDLPLNKKPISNGWIYKTKYKANEEIDRFKARLVIKGCAQVYGIDYQETFSPVVKYDSIRVILAIAAAKKLKLKQFDIKTAFLYGDIEEEIYMKQPIGYEDGSTQVCKLQRSLYGLKQAPRCWNKKFKTMLTNFNLKETRADSCVFISKKNKQLLIVAIFVDDGLIAATDNELVNDLVRFLKENFETKEGDLNQFLGIEVDQKIDGSIFIHQTSYCKHILSKFNMEGANVVHIPTDPQHSLDTTALESTPVEGVPYREAVGSLLYLSQITRPDITFAVNLVSRYLEKPKKVHWNAVKRIFKYLKSTPNYGLLYSSDMKIEVIGYSDADYAGDITTRRSTSGSTFIIGKGIVAWCSQRQKSVSLSTTESEYIALSQAVQELTWLMLLISDLLETQGDTPIMYADNQSAIRLVKNPEFHKRTKHIDVRYHYIREKYADGKFILEYVKSKDQLADIMTKPIPREQFQYLRARLQIQNNIS
jgi:transposase InsO family protein